MCVAFITTEIVSMKANSLSHSKQLITSRDGVKAFNNQIEGQPLKNISKSLPADITLDELSQLVFKKSYNQIIKSTETECRALLMQQWPGRAGIYIGVGEIKDLSNDIDVPAQIFITLFKINKPHNFEIISRTEKPFTFMIENPAKIEDFDNENPLDELVRIDCAPFQIAPKEFAFGLRLACNKGYSGGFAQFHNLILFSIKDKSLVPILNIPIYSLQNLAGNWNENGTREHYIIEKEWVVCLTEKKHNGYFDLQIKQKKLKNKSYQFIWTNGKYHCAQK